MDKTFEEIFNEMVASKSANPVLQGIDTTSKVSVWRQFLELVAWTIFNFQLAVKLHLSNIQFMIDNQKKFRLQEYRREVLRFQYGFDLISDTDQFKPTYLDNGIEVVATDDQIEASKIVKYAACNRVITDDKVKIVIKIAPENLDEIFSDQEMQAVGKFMDEIQPSGDNVVIINFLPDIVRFGFKIKVDPKVINSNGMNIITAQYPVNNAITRFLKNDLPFNGELSIQKFEKAILDVEGVEDLTTLFVESKWIDPNLNGYGLFQPINMSGIPESGRYKSEDFTGIQYIN